MNRTTHHSRALSTTAAVLLALLAVLLAACGDAVAGGAGTGPGAYAGASGNAGSAGSGAGAGASGSAGGAGGNAGQGGGGSGGGADGGAPGADAGSLAPGDYDWRAHLTLTSVPSAGYTGPDYGSPHYADVMDHTQPGSRYLSDTHTTNAHESMHGLEADMRNAKGPGVGFFYFEKGQGAYVEEPQMAAAKIKDYLPPKARELASSRYDLYLVQQVASWPNVLYQWDEWCAYKTNGRVAVEELASGTWTDGMVDEVDGAMDFLVFATASVRGLQVNEAAKLDDPQFKAAFAMLAEESMKYVTRGLATAELSGFHAQALLDELRTGAGSADLRATLVTWLGPVWTMRVLGF